MRRISILLLLTALVALIGCITLSADPRLVGTYSGADSESLIFLPDTRVIHVRIASGREQRVSLGYAAARSSAPRSLSIIGPDSSRFVGTSFHVSDDFATVTVQWNDLRHPEDNSRQVRYQRKTDGGR